jgi:hypothetical protein
VIVKHTRAIAVGGGEIGVYSPAITVGHLLRSVVLPQC